MTLAELEQQEKHLAKVRDRVFRSEQMRNRAQLDRSVAANWLKHYRDEQLPDMLRFRDALEDVKRVSLDRLRELDAELEEPEEDFFATHPDDAMAAYTKARKRDQRKRDAREEIALLRERIKACDSGGLSKTDVPSLLEARGIRPLPGYTVVYRGAGRTAGLRVLNKALDGLRLLVAEHEAKLDAATKVLAQLEQEDITS